MTGARRAGDYVVARTIIRVLAVAVLLMSLGNALALGCVYAWLNAFGHPQPGVLWLVLAAVGSQFLAVSAAMLAYGWSR